jgi:ABC-type uncharacterized transport system substrate-binding protein
MLSARGCARGYVDGQNVTLEARWAEGRRERFPELIGDLIRRKVSVILAISVPAALAAKNGTNTIPIVFIATDPVGLGLARPGGNLTGMSLFLGEEFRAFMLGPIFPKLPGPAARPPLTRRRPRGAERR